jgi:hypothetical protein
MADVFYDSIMALENKDSFYNAIRLTGNGATPFWDSLGNGIPFKGDPSGGHNFLYQAGPTAGGGQDNAYAEGSKRADITSFAPTKLHNELQIFKKTSGITKSQERAWTIEEKRASIQKQQMLNRKQLRLDIEAALLSENTPVAAATLPDIRKMGGIKSFIPAPAVFDIANAALSVKNHIDEALKFMYINGLAGENIIIMAGADVFTDLNWYYSDANLWKTGTGIWAQKKTLTTGWHENVTLDKNPNLAANEALIYAPDLINPVLLRAEKNVDCSDKTYDARATEDIFEMTLQTQDPNACIWLKNVGRTS